MTEEQIIDLLITIQQDMVIVGKDLSEIEGISGDVTDAQNAAMTLLENLQTLSKNVSSVDAPETSFDAYIGQIQEAANLAYYLQDCVQTLYLGSGNTEIAQQVTDQIVEDTNYSIEELVDGNYDRVAFREQTGYGLYEDAWAVGVATETIAELSNLWDYLEDAFAEAMIGSRKPSYITS